MAFLRFLNTSYGALFSGILLWLGVVTLQPAFFLMAMAAGLMTAAGWCTGTDCLKLERGIRLAMQR